MTDQAPERIYLQDAGDYAATVKFEVTWCVEPVDDADTQYLRLDLHEAEVAKLRAERDEARDWLAKANNEFGSQTWSWPNLWQRIAQLKELSNERWKRAVSAEADIAAMRKAAEALAEAAHPYVSPMQNADYGRQLRQHEALVAALAAYRATKDGTK